MIFCVKCGFQNPDDAVFCASCGSRITPDGAHAFHYEEHESRNPEMEREYRGYTSYVQERDPRPNPSDFSTRIYDEGRNWACVTGFVMGLVSLILTPIFNILAIPGLIISILGLKGRQRGLSIAGIVLSVLGLVAGIAVLALITLFFVGVSAMDPSELQQFEYFMDEFSGLAALLSSFIR